MDNIITSVRKTEKELINEKSKIVGSYKRKWNTESVRQFILDNNIDVELLSEYIDMYTKMKFKCSCGNIFYTNLHEFNNKKFPKRQCNSCGRNKSNDKNKIKCDDIKKYLIDNNYSCKLLSDTYVNCDSKLEFECECGNHFFASWSNIKKMTGLCKSCSGKLKSNMFSYSIEELNNISNDIYKNNEFKICKRLKNRKILIKHNKCNNTFEIRLDHFINGNGCSICNLSNKDNGNLSNEEFVLRLNNMFPDYEVLDEYINNRTRLRLRCKICNTVFINDASHIFSRGCKCPICNGSIGEISVSNYLKNKKISFIPQYRFDDCIDKRALPFDFYLDELNICIEYQGRQHYEYVDYFGDKDVFEKQLKHDNIKRKYCEDNNIQLIEIPYWEFNNLNLFLDNAINKALSFVF